MAPLAKCPPLRAATVASFNTQSAMRMSTSIRQPVCFQSRMKKALHSRQQWASHVGDQRNSVRVSANLRQSAHAAVAFTEPVEVLQAAPALDSIHLLQKAHSATVRELNGSQPPLAYPASPYPRRKKTCATRSIDEPPRLIRHPIVYAPKGTVGVVEHIGWKGKMEDRHAVMTEVKPMDGAHARPLIAGVFDGHYGHLAADYSARHLPHTVASHPLLWSVPDGHEDEKPVVEEVLKFSFNAVDGNILAEARRNPQVWRCGSTALLSFLRGSALYTANAGDCRAVLCRNGEAQRITQDHNVHNPNEKLRISQVGGKLHFMRGWRIFVDSRDGLPGRGLNVTRGMGDYHFKEPVPLLSSEPDVVRTPLEPGDAFMLMASDGLWSVLSDSEAVDIVKQELAGCSVMGGEWEPAAGWAHKAGNTLIETALDRGAVDNITAVVMLLDWRRPLV